MPSRESHDDGQRIFVAGPTALGDAVSAARRCGLEMGLDPRDEARLCIIIEELIANLLEHGREPAERRISFAIARQDSSVQISIEDDGPPFDPRSAEFDAPIPDRGGGAGLRLVRAWAEVAGYRTAEGRNRLDLTMKLTDD